MNNYDVEGYHGERGSVIKKCEIYHSGGPVIRGWIL